MLMRIGFVVILMVGVPTAGGANAPDPNGEPELQECHRNFEVEGSFFRGKTFRTVENLGDVVIADAVKRMGREIVKRGYEGVDIDTELGTITAHQTVSFGQGKTVPLNIVLDQNEDGEVVAEVVFQLSGGLGTDKEEVRAEFCEILQEGREPREK